MKSRQRVWVVALALFSIAVNADDSGGNGNDAKAATKGTDAPYQVKDGTKVDPQTLMVGKRGERSHASAATAPSRKGWWDRRWCNR